MLTHWPVAAARLTSRFGPRINPVTNRQELHPGIDLAGPKPGDKVPVLAAAAGTVVRVDVPANGGGYGYQCIIDHGVIGGQRVFTQYAHLDGKPDSTRVEDGSFTVKRGQRVEGGQQIARMGTTGLSSGVHLHFEVRIGSARAVSNGGEVVDPIKWLPANP